MDNSATRRHPLNVAGADGPVISHAVAVLDSSGEDIGDGFDPAMRVPGETGQVVLRNVIAEVVKKEERVELAGVAETERTAQMHARAFDGWLGLDQSFHWTKGHWASSTEKDIRDDTVGPRLRSLKTARQL